MTTPSDPTSPDPTPAASHSIGAYLFLALVCVLTWIVLASAFGNAQALRRLEEVDASACFALYNTNILLGSSSSVPPTEVLNGALAHGPETPVPVRVAQRTSDSLGVELSSPDAKAYPELVSAYKTVRLSTLQNHEMACPHSQGARYLVQRLVNASYGS